MHPTIHSVILVCFKNPFNIGQSQPSKQQTIASNHINQPRYKLKSFCNDHYKQLYKVLLKILGVQSTLSIIAYHGLMEGGKHSAYIS